MRQLVTLMKALSDENRLRVLVALKGRELCLCQIVELLGLATSTVSKHMAILHHAGLVDSRKHGRWNHFRLAANAPSGIAARATALVLDALAKDGRVRGDAKALRAILNIDAEELCRRQLACKS
jgi:ArsR family transcriptional regulator